MNFAAKEAIARVRIQPTEWEEIFAGYPSERIVSRLYTQ